MRHKFFKLEIQKVLVLVLSASIFIVSCKNESKEQDDSQMQENRQDTITNTDRSTQVEPQTFTGEISTINGEANGNDEVSGNVEIRVEGDLMRIVVTAEGLAPDMMHMQHLQTSGRGQEIPCPGSDADANNDGIVDVTEVSPNAQGIHMIPLHMGPSSLDMNVDTYPRTNVNGELQFKRTISLDSLRTAVREEFGMQDLDFTRFTYIIQGVGEDAKIPQTAQTLSGVAMNKSIPVGCAKLEE